jgi:predicted nucleic acid-binding Zn ribbon protein
MSERPPHADPAAAHPSDRTDRRFTPIGETLAAYLARTGIAQRIEEASAVPEWAERVGPGIAAVTRPVAVARGTLIVAVRSSAWLMELHLMEREIVRRINVQREKGRIDRIRFVMDDGEPPPRRTR